MGYFDGSSRPEFGEPDAARFRALKPAEREMWQFKAEFAAGVLRRRPCQPEALAMGATALTTLGFYSAGLALDARLFALRPRDPVVVYNYACSLALNGRAEEALDTLENAVGLGYRDTRSIASDPDLASLRSLPRFQGLLNIVDTGIA